MIDFKTACEMAAGRVGIDAEVLLSYAAEDDLGGQDSRPDHWGYLSLFEGEGKLLYALTRYLKPQRVLEIGTADGCSASHILAAMEKNEAGKLVSLDINKDAGQKIPPALRHRWEFVCTDAVKWVESHRHEFFDMAVEDGSHELSFTVAMLRYLTDIQVPFVFVHDPYQYKEVREAVRRFYPHATYLRINPSVAGAALWAADSDSNRVKVSIVSGTYNRLPYLKNMVASARAALPYGTSYEIILVDGNSSDGTIEWAKTQRDVKLIEQGELRGGIAAFNVGCAAARGEYVVVANDDITFEPNAISAALVHLEDTPRCGGVAFAQISQARSDWHVNTMQVAGGGSVPYAQVGMFRRDLGDMAEWWALPGARHYGSDNWLSAQIWEMGYRIDAVPLARVKDYTPNDHLRFINNVAGTRGGNHPDSMAFHNAYPHGILKVGDPQYPITQEKRRRRVLFAPMFEDDYPIQKVQKNGLRHALQAWGDVIECDYYNTCNLYTSVMNFHPDVLVTELRSSRDMNEAQAKAIKERFPNLLWVNWYGDFWDRPLKDEEFVRAMQFCDLNTVVNGDLIAPFEARGIKTKFWQIGMEVDGLVIDPTKLPQVQNFDVLFLGNNYSPDRVALEKVLRALPCKVGIFGRHWQRAEGENLYDYRQGAALYHNAKIAISDAQWAATDRYCSNRIFQAMAARGAVVLQQRFKGMDYFGFVDEETVFIWDTLNDLPALIERALKDKARRKKVVENAYRLVLTRHTFDVRLKELQELLQEVERV